MTFAVEQEYEQVGASRGLANHDRDLLHELSRHVDSYWRMDQYIANADWRDNLRNFWEDLKHQEENNIHRMKQLLAEEIRNDCF
jgi:hypothetical protein